MRKSRQVSIYLHLSVKLRSDNWIVRWLSVVMAGGKGWAPLYSLLKQSSRQESPVK